MPEPGAAEIPPGQRREDGEAFLFLGEGELVRVFTFLGDHRRLPAGQGHDLPVDMLHVRLEEILTITGDGGHGGIYRPGSAGAREGTGWSRSPPDRFGGVSDNLRPMNQKRQPCQGCRG